MVAAALLLGSLPGPWLTLGFPVAAAFAIHDRRVAARAAGWGVVVLVAALMAVTPMGLILLAAAIMAQAATDRIALAGRRRLGLGEAALPAVAGAAVALGLGWLLAPAAVEGWEAALGNGAMAAVRQTVERYRALGLDAAAVNTLELSATAAATGFVRLWPALTALVLWLGVWLGYRLLGRWGRPASSLKRRLGARPFDRFRLGPALIWVVIAALIGLWLPSDMARRTAVNMLAVGAVLYGLQGLAVGVWWMNRRGIGAVMRALLLVALFLLLSPVMIAATVLLGLAEHWLTLRDRTPAGRASTS